MQIDSCSGHVVHGKKFHSQHELRMSNDHLAVSINCLFCGKTFSQQRSYLNHMLFHAENKENECFECGKKFLFASSLHRHKRQLHTNIKDVVCDICDQKFNDIYALSRHTEYHVKDMDSIDQTLGIESS